ncbi:reverse transcriptase domain-containing protein, partial [Tanacetum coccineum]
ARLWLTFMLHDANGVPNWYCKVHGEIEGELRDEANVADSCKGAVSFDSAMFEKKNSQPLQKLMDWIGVDKSQLAQDILHSTRWRWSGNGFNWCEETLSTIPLSKMNRFPNKNGSKFGYQKTPTVASSCFGSSSYRKDKGVVDARNITMIKDVDPILDNITVHGRCISLWHSHRMNQAHNPYSLDMVLQDSQNTGTLTNDALSWWNAYAQPMGIEQANQITWTELKRLLTNKYCPRTEIRKMEEELYSLIVKGNDLKPYVRRF